MAYVDGYVIVVRCRCCETLTALDACRKNLPPAASRSYAGRCGVTTVLMMAAFYGLAFSNIFLRSTMGILAPELAEELALSPGMLGLVASKIGRAHV